MSETTPYPKFKCVTCEDWGSVVAPDGHGTLPCPEPIHRTATTTPISGPSAGEETEKRAHDDDDEH